MKRCGFLTALFLLAAVNAQAQSPFIAPGEIRPGMKGYGMSVFHGWEAERFEIEVVDVMPGAWPGSSVILAKATGAGLEKSGIIAGMSGSPVYISNRLAGAVAYTWANSKEALCGITPIAQMLAERDRDRALRPVSQATNGFVPVQLPLTFSGFSPTARQWLASRLPVSFAESAGGSAGLKSPGPMKGGDAVALNLVDGDISMAGVGTVTYVSNDDIYIFGHPMDGAGETRLPLSRAYIYSVVASSYLSFKLGGGSEPVGAAVYDGTSAVYGRLGEKSAMVPMTLRMERGGLVSTSRFRVASSRLYFAMMGAAAVASSLETLGGIMEDTRLAASVVVRWNLGGQEVSLTNEFMYAYAPSYYNQMTFLEELQEYLGLCLDTPFGRGIPLGAEVSARVLPGRDYAILEGAEADRTAVYPGEKVNIRLLVRRSDFTRTNIYLALTVPRDAKPGQAALVCGSPAAIDQEMLRQYSRYFAPLSWQELVSLAGRKRDTMNAAVSVIWPGKGLIYQDRKMKNFPEQYQSFLSRQPDRNGPAFPREERVSASLGRVLFGSSRLNLTIQQKTTQATE